jgi:Legionella pneumophila major outer membrane protein precursor
MLKKAMSLLVAAVMLQGTASADWANDFMCGNFWVAGEALLLRPTGMYPYAAIVGPVVERGDTANQFTLPFGDQCATCPDYKWGYKIELGYRNCDRDILINWTSFNNGYQNKFQAKDDNILWSTTGQPSLPVGIPEILAATPDLLNEALINGTLAAKSCIKYDVLDAEIGVSKCEPCSRFSRRMFAGLRYARIVNNRAAVVGPSELLVSGEAPGGVAAFFTLQQKSDVQGIGPRGGFGGRYDLFCGIGFHASMAGHLLIGSTKSSFEEHNFSVVPVELEILDENGVVSVRNRKVCRILPVSEIKFGFDWKPCLFCGLTGDFEVGYQISHYFYGSQDTFFVDNVNEGINRVRTDPVSFDGFYFRLGLMY